jgi:hypothetical protein
LIKNQTACEPYCAIGPLAAGKYEEKILMLYSFASIIAGIALVLLAILYQDWLSRPITITMASIGTMLWMVGNINIFRIIVIRPSIDHKVPENNEVSVHGDELDLCKTD